MPQITPPVLEYRTPDPAPSRALRGGFAKLILKAGATVTLFALLVPSEVGGNFLYPNPLRLIAIWLLLALAAWYVLDRMLSTPNQSAIPVVFIWIAAIAAFFFVYVQIWFLKNKQLPSEGGPWQWAVLWPSACVLGSLFTFVQLRNVRLPPAG